MKHLDYYPPAPLRPDTIPRLSAAVHYPAVGTNFACPGPPLPRARADLRSVVIRCTKLFDRTCYSRLRIASFVHVLYGPAVRRARLGAYATPGDGRMGGERGGVGA